MNDRYYAVANRGAKIEFQLEVGKKYILKTSQKSFGMAEVYDLDGNFIKCAQTDDFDHWEKIEN